MTATLPDLHIDNRSNYSTPLVCDLVAFGVHDIPLPHTGILVTRQNSHGYSGTAHWTAPKHSPWYKSACDEAHITIRVGSSDKFPCTNMWVHRNWRAVTPWVSKKEMGKAERRLRREAGVPKTNISYNCRYVHDGATGAREEQWRLYRLYEYEAPYGGTRSPLITLQTWQEAVVMVAAHEAYHIVQKREKTGKRKFFEYECELYANERLQAFRSGGHPILFEAYRRGGVPVTNAVEWMMSHPQALATRQEFAAGGG